MVLEILLELLITLSSPCSGMGMSRTITLRPTPAGHPLHPVEVGERDQQL